MRSPRSDGSRVARRRRRRSSSRDRGGIDAAASRSARRSSSGTAAALSCPDVHPDRVPPLAPAREERGSAPAARSPRRRPLSGSSGGGDRRCSPSRRGARRTARRATSARRTRGSPPPGRSRRRGRSSLLARPVSYRPSWSRRMSLLVAAVAACARGVPCAATRRGHPARRATDRAQEIMGGRAEIAAMIAHEVRGPVSTVRGLAGHRALALRPAGRRRATRALGAHRAGIPPTARHGDAGVHGAEGRRGHRHLRHPAAGARRRRSARASPPPTSAQHPLELDLADEEVAPRPEMDHRGRPPARRQRGEVLAAGRADLRERPGRGRRRDDRGDRPRTGHPARAPRRRVRQVSELASRRVRAGSGLRAWALPRPRHRRSAIGERCTSSTPPVGVRCSASGSPWRASWTTDRAP